MTKSILFAWLIAVNAFGDSKTIVRSWARDGTNYMVNFTYDPTGGFFVPATNPPGQAHYGCMVSVWAGGAQVGESFKGEVTEHGCFEDKPEDAVAKALSQNLALHTQTNVFRIGSSNLPGGMVISTNAQVLIGGAWPTNIVISNDYSGTIQIGTNFFKMSEIRKP